MRYDPDLADETQARFTGFLDRTLDARILGGAAANAGGQRAEA